MNTSKYEKVEANHLGPVLDTLCSVCIVQCTQSFFKAMHRGWNSCNNASLCSSSEWIAKQSCEFTIPEDKRIFGQVSKDQLL